MKNLIKHTLICLLGIFIFSCGDDDSACSQSDWVGTYTITTDSICELDAMNSLIFNQKIVIAVGSTETTIDWDEDEVTFTECTATDEIVELTLNGNTITSKIGECTATYNKN